MSTSLNLVAVWGSCGSGIGIGVSIGSDQVVPAVSIR